MLKLILLFFLLSSMSNLFSMKTDSYDTIAVCKDIWGICSKEETFSRLQTVSWDGNLHGVILDDSLFVVTSSGNLMSADLREENLVFKRVNPAGDDWRTTRALFAYNGKLIALADRFWEIDPRTGAYRDMAIGTGWNTTRLAAINGDIVFVITNAGGLWKVDLKSRTYSQLPDEWSTSKALIAYKEGFLSIHNQIYFIQPDGKYNILTQMGTGWTTTRRASVVIGNELHATTDSGTYYIADLESGKLRKLPDSWNSTVTLLSCDIKNPIQNSKDVDLVRPVPCENGKIINIDRNSLIGSENIAGGIQFDTTYWQKDVLINNKKYDHAICLHTPRSGEGYADFSIPKGCKKIKLQLGICQQGPASSSSKRAKIEGHISIDGERKWVGVLEGPYGTVLCEVPDIKVSKNAKTLRIGSCTKGADNGGCHFVCLNPQFSYDEEKPEDNIWNIKNTIDGRKAEYKMAKERYRDENKLLQQLNKEQDDLLKKIGNKKRELMQKCVCDKPLPSDTTYIEVGVCRRCKKTTSVTSYRDYTSIGCCPGCLGTVAINYDYESSVKDISSKCKKQEEITEKQRLLMEEKKRFYKDLLTIYKGMEKREHEYVKKSIEKNKIKSEKIDFLIKQTEEQTVKLQKIVTNLDSIQRFNTQLEDIEKEIKGNILDSWEALRPEIEKDAGTYGDSIQFLMDRIASQLSNFDHDIYSKSNAEAKIKFLKDELLSFIECFISIKNSLKLIHAEIDGDIEINE